MRRRMSVSAMAVAVGMLLIAGCSGTGPATANGSAPTLLTTANLGLYKGPGEVVQAWGFTRDTLVGFSVWKDTFVAGILEPVHASWGPLYKDMYRLPTSLLIHTASRREVHWRPHGERSALSGYSTPAGIVVARTSVRPLHECAALQALRFCERWSLLLLDPRTLATQTLYTAPRAIDGMYSPAVRAEGRNAVFTETEPGGGSLLKTVSLDTGAIRTVARLPFPEVALSGSITGTVIAAAVHDRESRAVVVDMRWGNVAPLAKGRRVVQGPRAVAWTEPAGEDGDTLIRVRPADHTHALPAFGVPNEDTYYALWVDAETLVAATAGGLDVYRNVLSTHPVHLPVADSTDYLLEVGISAGDGQMAFALGDGTGWVSGSDAVTFFIVRL